MRTIMMPASKDIVTHSLQDTPHFGTTDSYGLQGSVLNGSLHYWAKGSDVLLSA